MQAIKRLRDAQKRRKGNFPFRFKPPHGRIAYPRTDGELFLHEGENRIVLKKYFGEDREWKISDLTDDLEGHGGGDHRMLDKLYEILAEGNKNVDTSIENSVESHYMAIAAEESRLAGGALVDVAPYRNA